MLTHVSWTGRRSFHPGLGHCIRLSRIISDYKSLTGIGIKTSRWNFSCPKLEKKQQDFYFLRVYRLLSIPEWFHGTKNKHIICNLRCVGWCNYILFQIRVIRITNITWVGGYEGSEWERRKILFFNKKIKQKKRPRNNSSFTRSQYIYIYR